MLDKQSVLSMQKFVVILTLFATGHS